MDDDASPPRDSTGAVGFFLRYSSVKGLIGFARESALEPGFQKIVRRWMDGIRKESGDWEDVRAAAAYQLALLFTVDHLQYIPDHATRREGRCRLIAGDIAMFPA